MKQTKLQKLSTIVSEAEVEKEKLVKDHKKILARLEQTNQEIAALEEQRKDIYLELNHSEHVLVDRENQIQATKNRIADIVAPWINKNGCAVTDKAERGPY